MSYFRIVNDNYFVNGERGGVIYNLRNGELIHLDIKQKDFISFCEKNISISNSIKKASLDKESAVKLMKYLLKNEIGIINKRKVYIDKYEYIRSSPWQITPINLSSVFLNINSSCDYKCKHCNDTNLYYYYKCNTKNLFISGGDPFKDLSYLRDLCIDAANIVTNNIYIITNGYILKHESSKKLLQQTKIHPIINFFGYNKDIYESRTRIIDSYDRVLENINWLEKQQIKYSLNFNIFLYKSSFKVQYYKYKSAISNLNPTLIFYTEINNKPEFENENKNFKTSQSEYYYNQRYHTCMAFAISIDSSGKILPCPHFHEFQLGNIYEVSLKEILQSEKIHELWTLTKDKIDPCKVCEYRYACYDCRLPESKLKKTITCSYNTIS